METAHPLNDEKFASALSSVVWQFHVYGAYSKKQNKAIKALSKRAPGHTAELYKEMFELSLNILLATINAVEKAPKSPKPGQDFSELSDVDTDFVLNQLRTTFPQQTDDFIQSHIAMVIYWYYLR